MVTGKWKVKNDCGDRDESWFGCPNFMFGAVGIDRAGVQADLMGKRMTTTMDTESTEGKAVDTVYGVIGRGAELQFITRFG